MAALTRWRVSFSCMLTAATLLAGCPAPTGRHRGRNDAAVCTTTATPTDGAMCTVVGDVCEATRPCDFSAATFRVDSCRCVSMGGGFGFWQCIEGQCNAPPDSGTGTCPPAIVQPDSACSNAQFGLYCSGGPLRDCNGGMALVPCWCNGSTWSCGAMLCRDAGVEDSGDGAATCPSGQVASGDLCLFSELNLMCNIGSIATCGSRVVYGRCLCDGNHWSCQPPVCDRPDASVSDAMAACPSNPSPGSSCAPGLECRYSGACETYCYCASNGRIACDTISCRDASVDVARSG